MLCKGVINRVAPLWASAWSLNLSQVLVTSTPSGFFLFVFCPSEKYLPSVTVHVLCPNPCSETEETRNPRGAAALQSTAIIPLLQFCGKLLLTLKVLLISCSQQSSFNTLNKHTVWLRCLYCALKLILGQSLLLAWNLPGRQVC